MNGIIDINLLPEKRKKRKVSKEEKQAIIIGFVIGALLVGVYLRNISLETHKKNKLNELNTQITALKSVQDLLNKRNAIGNELFYYETTITSLTKKQTDWNSLIDEIAKSMPKEAVLQSINVNRKTGLVEITGYAPTFQKLAWTFNAISANENFVNVKLESYSIPLEKKTTQNKPNNATFTISFQWKGMKK